MQCISSNCKTTIHKQTKYSGSVTDLQTAEVKEINQQQKKKKGDTKRAAIVKRILNYCLLE